MSPIQDEHLTTLWQVTEMKHIGVVAVQLAVCCQLHASIPPDFECRAP